MAVLILAEHDHQTIKPSTLSTITAARQLSDEIVVLIVGHDSQPAAQQAASVSGVTKVVHLDAPAYEHHLAETLAPVIVEHAKNYAYIMAPATTLGKNIMPRVAALLDVMQISDVTEIIDQDTFIRPIYAGNAFAKVRSHDKIKVLTVRATAFEKAQITHSAADIITDHQTTQPNILSAFVNQTLNKSDRPELSSARVVVSGGRGLQSGENFALLEKLATHLNAAIGASRAAVDAGFVPNDYQVGQTGKVVAPDLYIAIGISGAIQHLAGMKDSKVIVAINKDADAPIFQIADYGLVGDLFELVPQLIEQLN
ncbi:MAG: FAD-binding protein [Gammaproteobacteria bacterium]